MTKFRLQIAALVYGILTIGAIIWGIVRPGVNIFHHPTGLLANNVTSSFFIIELLIGGASGVAFGFIIVRLSRFSVYRFQWAKNLHTEFRSLFGSLRDVDIFAFAIFSAIGEELLFRGVLQSEIGIIPTSLIFGLLHFAPSKKYISWPLQATIMGFALGGLFWITGNLAAPILAHFTINYQNLHFINKYDPSLQLPRSFTVDAKKRNFLKK